VGGSGAASNILDQRLEIACMVYRKMIINAPTNTLGLQYRYVTQWTISLDATAPGMDVHPD